MIAEKIPELSKLTSEERMILAGELWSGATDFQAAEPDPRVVEILRERLQKYQANPEAVKPWSEVKASILKGE